MNALCVTPDEAAGLLVLSLAAIGAAAVALTAVGFVLVFTMTIPDLTK